MKNLVFIAIYLFGANAFAMSPVELRKDTIVTKTIGTESVCLEIASATAPTIRKSLKLDNDSNFALKCLPYKGKNDSYALVADSLKEAKIPALKFSFQNGMYYSITFLRRESRPRALMVEDHVIQNGEVVVLRSSRQVDYSVMVPIQKKYHLAAMRDIFGDIKRDIKMYGKDSKILGFVYNPSSAMNASGILIHLDQ